MRLILAFLLAFSAVAQAASPCTLHGQWQQGGLVIGKTNPAATVVLDGRRLGVSPQGYFVFGFDRDAAATTTLTVQLPGQPAESKTYPVRKRLWKVQRINGLPPDKVTPPPEVEARIEHEAAEVKAAREQDSALEGFTEPLQWPAHGEVSGVFGSQRILNGIPKQPHPGEDIVVPTGTPVTAPASGVIALAEPDLYFTGGTIIIDHGHGLSSVLVHLSKLLVRVGDPVKQGQVVGKSGMTGRATGPHLHWGIYWFDAHIDPRSAMAATASLPH